MDNFFLRLVTVDSHFRLSLVTDDCHFRYFFRKKKQKLQKAENTGSLPLATIGKRRVACNYVHPRDSRGYVRSQQLRYTPKGHAGNVFGGFRFKSIYLEEIQAPNACNPQLMCV
jgi:hypothetical protein